MKVSFLNLNWMGPQNKAFRGKTVPWTACHECCPALKPQTPKSKWKERGTLKATFSLPTLFTDNRPPASQIRVAGCEKQAGILGLGVLLTFDELSEIRSLLQTGLQVQELAVAAVHGVVGHLLQAAAVLSVESRLVLSRERLLAAPAHRHTIRAGQGQGSMRFLFCPRAAQV